jgi:D-alanyl-D-alanine carboxypeptidase
MTQLSRRNFFTLLGAAALAGCGGNTTSGLLNSSSTMTPSTAFDAATLARLNIAIDKVFEGVESPGLIAGVWVGSRAWKAVRGTTTLNGNAPAGFDLYTRIGSVTKTLTGTVILQLIEEGLLSFEDTLDHWYPTIAGSNGVTIRHLGTMASGLESYTSDPNITDQYFANPTRSWDPEELMFAGASLPRKFTPGQGFSYSNTNLVALGLIAEKILGQNLADILQNRIFSPLQMTRSSYPYGLELPQPHWSGYTLQGSPDEMPVDSTNWSPTFAAGAGQAVSTFADLYLWGRALGTGALLTTATQTARLVANPFSVNGVRSYCFAVGLDNGWISHSGELPGFNTQVAYLPDLDATIVVMANADIPGADGRNPAVAGFTALAGVVAPNNVP